MTQGHRVLIVEDDDEIAADLGELVRAIYPDIEIQFTDNRERALALFDEMAFCFVLLDLRIKRTPSSLRGTIEAGINVLAEIRRIHSEYAGEGFRLPVIVVTASISERDSAVAIMRDGASDLIGKPFGTDAAARIRACMTRAGRTQHTECTNPRLARVEPAPARLVIEIPPVSANHPRTRVLIAGCALTLPPTPLYALLQLVAAKLRGQRVDAANLSVANRPHQVVSDLRSRLRTAHVPAADQIVQNEAGQYWLREDLEIAGVDLQALTSLGEHRISEIAIEISKTRE